MFTALGVLQRDAPSVTPTLSSSVHVDPAIPLLLIEDFTRELGSLSQEISALCVELTQSNSFAMHQEVPIDWERVMAAKRESIERLQATRMEVMEAYTTIMDQSIQLVSNKI